MINYIIIVCVVIIFYIRTIEYSLIVDDWRHCYLHIRGVVLPVLSVISDSSTSGTLDCANQTTPYYLTVGSLCLA